MIRQIHRHLALLLNFLCPGVGSLLLGKWGQGLVQLAILTGSLLAFAYSFHTMYAVIAIAATYIWALVTAEWSPHTGAVERH